MNKRMVPCEKRAEAGAGQQWWGGRPLIKRIILRCTVLQRSCPLGPRLTTVMKPIPVGGEGGRASEEVEECRTERGDRKLFKNGSGKSKQGINAYNEGSSKRIERWVLKVINTQGHKE